MFPSLPSQQVLARTGLAPADVRHYHGTLIACTCCGQLLHARCVREASTLVSWKHLWFSNPGMRRLIEERRLFGLDVAFCQRCRDDLLEQILGNYRALLEGARFRGDLGTTGDVPRWRERWGGLATYIIAYLLGEPGTSIPTCLRAGRGRGGTCVTPRQ